ncbi:TPA: type II toxin-antitoxin system MqsA family antitoxin [Vibrio alginolyticus]
MTNTTTCSICEEGNLQPHVGHNLVDYKGHQKELDIHYSECDCCGSEITVPAQSRANKRLMTEFKKQVDGLLTGKELRELRLGFGLTQADAAKVFGGGPVAFSKYEADDVAQSEAMDKLLRLAQALPKAYAYLTHNSTYMEDVEGVAPSAPSAQWDWEQLVPDLSSAKKSKPRPVLRLISSKDFEQNEEGYGQLQAVG